MCKVPRLAGLVRLTFAGGRGEWQCCQATTIDECICHSYADSDSDSYSRLAPRVRDYRRTHGHVL